jgi:PadR family transcriptional regulator, regulatory protein PadR
MDVLQGTLDLLVLRVLAAGPQHGWAIGQRIREQSETLLQVNQGSLYPALHRLEDEGWIEGSWVRSETQRRVKEYRLTRSGRKRLGQELEAWRSYTRAVDLILEAT